MSDPDRDPLFTVKLLAHPFTGAPMSDSERADVVTIIRELERRRTEVAELEARLDQARAEVRLWEEEARRG